MRTVRVKRMHTISRCMKLVRSCGDVVVSLDTSTLQAEDQDRCQHVIPSHDMIVCV
jgi:hypothetical protein